MEGKQILEQALELEKQGRKFYLEAAGWAKDEKLAGLLRDLAEDEANHTEFLERELRALAAGEQWLEIPELVAPDATGAEAVFPAGREAPARVGSSATAEEILLFALDIEVRSQRLYRQAEQGIDHPLARQLFARLAAVEQAHFDSLMHLYEGHFGYPR